MTIVHAPQRLWTVEEFNRMADLGLLQPGERVELIEGEIITLCPQNKPHADATSWATNLMVEKFGRTHLVRVQLPLEMGAISEPEPDVALVPKQDLARARRHPTAADLVLEISDSSLAYDRCEKASLYARFAIPEYWILNLVEGCLEIHLDPAADPAAPFEFSYRDRTVVGLEGTVTPRFLPPAEVAVRDLIGS